MKKIGSILTLGLLTFTITVAQAFDPNDNQLEPKAIISAEVNQISATAEHIDILLKDINQIVEQIGHATTDESTVMREVSQLEDDAIGLNHQAQQEKYTIESSVDGDESGSSYKTSESADKIKEIEVKMTLHRSRLLEIKKSLEK